MLASAIGRTAGPVRGLWRVESLTELGVQPVAISVDAPRHSMQVVTRTLLPFDILGDLDRGLISDLDLVHKGAGPGGSDIAVPSIILANADRRILWQHRSTRSQDRLSPENVLDGVRGTILSATQKMVSR